MNERAKFLKESYIYDYEIVGDYYIGYCNMIFGVRVRAGELFKGWCDVDICCGSAEHLRTVIKQLYIHKMRINYSNNSPVFDGLLYGSQNKPVFNDKNYMFWMAKLYTDVFEKLPSFTINYDFIGYAESIECLVCKRRSFHQDDIRQLYCGNCNRFHIRN